MATPVAKISHNGFVIILCPSKQCVLVRTLLPGRPGYLNYFWLHKRWILRDFHCVSNESIADKHPINIQIFCRKLCFRCQRILRIIFGVEDQVRYTASRLHWPAYALQRQILHLPAPPPNRLFVISQILGDTWQAFSRVSLPLAP